MVSHHDEVVNLLHIHSSAHVVKVDGEASSILVEGHAQLLQHAFHVLNELLGLALLRFYDDGGRELIEHLLFFVDFDKRLNAVGHAHTIGHSTVNLFQITEHGIHLCFFRAAQMGCRGNEIGDFVPVGVLHTHSHHYILLAAQQFQCLIADFRFDVKQFGQFLGVKLISIFGEHLAFHCSLIAGEFATYTIHSVEKDIGFSVQQTLFPHFVLQFGWQLSS